MRVILILATLLILSCGVLLPAAAQPPAPLRIIYIGSLNGYVKPCG
ncbi:MAG: hypothetical protein JXO49_07810 [Deltaproteobacteria bacterium]|nr:hypothetical protein [Candidatus Anaeroferrophillus wilburensis]MBN2889233.1 hypothetical protein [Deltaproteobacteria bacterium]